MPDFSDRSNDFAGGDNKLLQSVLHQKSTNHQPKSFVKVHLL